MRVWPASQSKVGVILYLLFGIPMLSCALVPVHWHRMQAVYAQISGVSGSHLLAVLRIVLIVYLFPTVFFAKTVSFFPKFKLATKVARRTPDTMQEDVDFKETRRLYNISSAVAFLTLLAGMVLYGAFGQAWGEMAVSRSLLRLMVAGAALITSMQYIVPAFRALPNERSLESINHSGTQRASSGL